MSAIFYETCGSENAQTILFIPGAGVAREWWRPQIQDLSTDFRVLALDLPGQGPLSGEPFRWQRALKYLNDVVEKEVNGAALLVGISLGGYLAMAYAGQCPGRVAGLVLSGSSMNLSGLRGLSFRLTGSMLRRKGADWLKEVTLASYRKRIAPSWIEPVIAAGFYPDAAIDAFFEISGKNFYKMLRSYPGPILLANGEDDHLNRKAEKAFIKNIPRARSSPVQGASHLTNLEQPELFSQAIRGFAEGLAW